MAAHFLNFIGVRKRQCGEAGLEANAGAAEMRLRDGWAQYERVNRVHYVDPSATKL